MQDVLLPPSLGKRSGFFTTFTVGAGRASWTSFRKHSTSSLRGRQFASAPKGDPS